MEPSSEDEMSDGFLENAAVLQCSPAHADKYLKVKMMLAQALDALEAEKERGKQLQALNENQERNIQQLQRKIVEAEYATSTAKNELSHWQKNADLMRWQLDQALGSLEEAEANRELQQGELKWMETEMDRMRTEHEEQVSNLQNELNAESEARILLESRSAGLLQTILLMKTIADGKAAKAEKQGMTFEVMLEGLETQLHTARTEAEYYANRLEEDLAEQRAKIRASSQEMKKEIMHLRSSTKDVEAKLEQVSKLQATKAKQPQPLQALVPSTIPASTVKEAPAKEIYQIESMKGKSSSRQEPVKKVEVDRSKRKSNQKMRAKSDKEPDQHAEQLEHPQTARKADDVKNHSFRGGSTRPNSSEINAVKKPRHSKKSSMDGMGSRRGKRFVVVSDSEAEKAEAEPLQEDTETPSHVQGSESFNVPKRPKSSTENRELDSRNDPDKMEPQATVQASRALVRTVGHVQADEVEDNNSKTTKTSAGFEDSGRSVRDELAALCGYDTPCSSVQPMIETTQSESASPTEAIAQRADSPGAAPPKRKRVPREQVEDGSGAVVKQSLRDSAAKYSEVGHADVGTAPEPSTVDDVPSNDEIMVVSATVCAKRAVPKPLSNGGTGNVMGQGGASVRDAASPQELTGTPITEIVPSTVVDGHESDDTKQHGGVEDNNNAGVCKEDVPQQKTVKAAKESNARQSLSSKIKATPVNSLIVVADEANQGGSHAPRTSPVAVVDTPRSEELHQSISTTLDSNENRSDFGTKIQNTGTSAEPAAQAPNQAVRRPLSSISLAGAASKWNQATRMGSDSKSVEAAPKKRKLLPPANNSVLYTDTLPSSMLFGGSTFMIPKLKNRL